MKKSYPLEVIKLDEAGGDCMLGYFTKGHHSPEAFIEAVEADYDDAYRSSKVSHETWRMAWMMCDGERTPYYDVVAPGSRGGFPVTVVDGDRI
jgi:hypothetical protein